MSLTDYLLRDTFCFDCTDHAVEATHLDGTTPVCAHHAEAAAWRLMQARTAMIVRATLRDVARRLTAPAASAAA